MVWAGSIPSAGATSRNSATSSRRSPRSNFDTNDWGQPSLFARATWVRLPSRRAWTRTFRNCPCFRLDADLVTDAVCYPNLEYPKIGYTDIDLPSEEYHDTHAGPRSSP